MDNFYAPTGQNINEFIDNYRKALVAQRDSNNKQLQQNRKQAQTAIMGSANKAGMMYSNFPERAKMAYDAQTYEPALVKNQTSYQTALDSLRSNAINLWNRIKSYDEAIQDLNTYGVSSTS